ncbi:MAG: hypothetical protein COC06_11575 [Bacteroidales bacterium]|nr:MAG: hypothetical protein COC06_11575 [Bacteroidales bacterium]
MKNITEYNYLIEQELDRYKNETSKILEEIEHKFNKGCVVVTHHFNNADSDLISLVKSELEEAGFKPEFTGNKPGGHITLRVSLLRSAGIVA